MGTTNSSEKPQRRVKHGQRPTEPLADWPVEFGADGAGQPAATSGDAPADLTMYQAQSEFSDYFSKNYPMDTIIADPDWHSTKIWQAAMSILGRVERIEPATASGDEPLTVNGILVERADVGPACRYLTEHTILDGQALQAAWEKLVAFYVANRARAAVSAATKPTACTLPPAGWSCTRTPGHEGPCAAVPTEVCADDYTPEQFSIYQHGVEDGKLIARGMERYKAGIAARESATKPTADLSSFDADHFKQLLRDVSNESYFCGINLDNDEAYAGHLALAEAADKAIIDYVQSLLATKPAAAPAVPEGQTIIGKLLDQFSNIEHLWGLNEPGALVRQRDVFNLLIAAGKELKATPAASTTGAAQTAEQVRTAVARAIWNIRREEEDRYDMELEDMGDEHAVWQEADAAIQAMARHTTTHNSEAAK